MDLVVNISMINGFHNCLIHFSLLCLKYYMPYLMKCILQLIFWNSRKLSTINWKIALNYMLNIGIRLFLLFTDSGFGLLMECFKG